MTGRRSATALVAVLLLLAAPAVADDGALRGQRLFTIDDEDVFESSGLVDRGRVVYTTNDSGDDAVIYGLDARTGREVSRTKYADDATDVEALAPGADGTVWAGDIGDNQKRRDQVEVYPVDPSRRDYRAPRAVLRYPDGAHDAETLLVQPRTGRVFVVSKSVFGGTVYVAPSTLRTDGRANRLHAVADVGGLVTDGSFFPDGRHVVLRTYSTASVYTYPGFALVGTVRLPDQPQGEGISVSRTGRVLLSSEGVRAEVLRVRLPPALLRPSPSGAPTGPAPATRPLRPVAGVPHSRDVGDWVAIGAVVTVLLGSAAFGVSRVTRRR